MEQKPKNPVNPGDSNQITRAYLDSLLIEMRHLDNVLPSTKMTLFGRHFDTPIMTAAFSHLSNFQYHDDGMVEMARGARLSNAVNWAGMGSEAELESILATEASTIKIIKPYRDNDRIFRKIEHAQRVGAIAVGIDIDHSFNRQGGYDQVFEDEMRPKTTKELRAFVDASSVPFIVKGVLSVQDAVKCAEAGVQGIVVSHHHGIMDYAVPPLKVLPAIVEAVDAQIAVFVDCGIATGYDAFKALALGATAVCVGRAILPFLKEAGAKGVHEHIQRLTQELAGIMARTGSADLTHIDRTLIWEP